MGKAGELQAVRGSVTGEILSDDKSCGKVRTSEVIKKRTGRKFLSLANARKLPKSGEY